MPWTLLSSKLRITIVSFLQQDVDRIVEIKTEVTLKQIVYLHAPVWFIKYEYKGKVLPVDN